MSPTPELLQLAAIAHAAGVKIMEIYGTDFTLETKADASPVTAADQAAETIILAALKTHWPDVPVVAEEAVARGHTPQVANTFFLVDPLDGTREFIARNGEFTVNIGRIANGAPVAGVIYAPAMNEMYLGASGTGAFYASLSPASPASAASYEQIHARPCPARGADVLASRSHLDPETQAFIAAQNSHALVNAGSSLKFCRIAQGKADLYPRFGRTMEWDTAAGHAILLAAGGSVALPSGGHLTYGKPGFANPPFIARGR